MDSYLLNPPAGTHPGPNAYASLSNGQKEPDGQKASAGPKESASKRPTERANDGASRGLKGALIASAMAGVFACAAQSKNVEPEAAAVEPPEGGEPVQCLGVNECKSQSACRTSENACKGQNDCAGKGWQTLPEDDCLARGGTVSEG